MCLPDDPLPERDQCAIAFITLSLGCFRFFEGNPHHALEIDPHDPLPAVRRVRPDLFIAAQEPQLRVEL
jgi:hypothetical protein